MFMNKIVSLYMIGHSNLQSLLAMWDRYLFLSFSNKNANIISFVFKVHRLFLRYKKRISFDEIHSPITGKSSSKLRSSRLLSVKGRKEIHRHSNVINLTG